MSTPLNIVATFDGATATDLAGAALDPATRTFNLAVPLAGRLRLWTFPPMGARDWFIQAMTVAIPVGGTVAVSIVYPSGFSLAIPPDIVGDRALITNLLVPQGCELAISTLDGVGAPAPSSVLLMPYGVNDKNYAPLTCCHLFAPGGAMSPTDDSCCFVYRPGEPTPTGNVFADFAALVAAVALVDGYKTITVDTSITDPAPIPAGAWDMNQATFVGVPDAIANRELLAADGATLLRVGGFVGEVRLLSDSSGPVITLTAGQVLYVADGAEINAQDVGVGVPIVFMANGSRLIMDNRARLGANEDDPVVEVPGGETAQIQLIGGSRIDDHALAGAGDYLVNAMGADADIGQIQPAHAGVLTITPFLDPVQAALEILGGGITKRSGTVLATGNLSLPLAAQAAGPVWIRNDRSGPAGPVDITPSGADTIDGAATLRIRPRGCVLLKSDGISRWAVVCGRRFQTFSFQSPAVTLVLGTDLFLGFNLAGIAGTIDIAATVGLGSQLIVPSAGQPIRVCLRSSVAVAAGDTLEVRARVNGGAFTSLGTIVGPVGAGAVTIIEVPDGTFPFLPVDRLEVALRQTLGVGIILTSINVTLDLELEP